MEFSFQINPWYRLTRTAVYAGLLTIVAVTSRNQVGVIPVPLDNAELLGRPDVLMGRPQHPTGPRLTDYRMLPAAYQAAARQVAAALERENLRPAEYFVEIRSDFEGEWYTLDLWHESAVGNNWQPHTRGDPTGKCRSTMYEVRTGTIGKLHGWR